MRLSSLTRGVLLAVAAALAFGLSTPLIQRAGEGIGTFTVAALLYIGAAGLAGLTGGARMLPRSSWGTLAGMGLAGACLAPALLAAGLAQSSGVAASLLLNLEAVFTVLLAVIVHREAVGARVWVAVAVIAGGGALLAWDRGEGGFGVQPGLLLVIGATLGWAVDNTLSRHLAEAPPEQVVWGKGLIGAALSVLLARLTGEALPGWAAAAALLSIGAVGYGASLRLYLLAQRDLGSARTGSVFAVGPFAGALAAAAAGESFGGWLSAAGSAAILIGVWLHLTEEHDHPHDHPALSHDHPHRHDDGHHEDHLHLPDHAGIAPGTSHTHVHAHAPLSHRHPHGEDIHHRDH